MRAQKGKSTTLVAVLLAVVIVGGLIAYYASSRHQTTDRLNQALSVADGAKLVVAEAATLNHGLAGLRQEDLKFNANSAQSPYVKDISISATGRITISTQDTGAHPDPTFLLTPIQSSPDQSNLAWNCDVIVGDDSAKPASCRRTAPAPGGSVPAHPASS
jgi:type IV pilus assembly protein PilA